MSKNIRIASTALACCLLAVAVPFMHAQAGQAAKPAAGTLQTPSQVYGKLLSLVEKEFVGAAEAMPEDKFAFVPTQGEFAKVRSFGDQLKHVAEANGYFFHDPSKPLSDLKEQKDTIEKLKTKAEILKALKDSLAQAHTYVDAITPENAFVTTESGNTRAGLASFGIAHMMDHYGQLVVYLRMNGIVPPASRGGNNM